MMPNGADFSSFFSSVLIPRPYVSTVVAPTQCFWSVAYGKIDTAFEFTGVGITIICT